MSDHNKSDDNAAKENATAFIIKTMETQGIATASVSDGRIIMFKREYMQNLMAKHPEQEQFVIFIKTLSFAN